MSEEEKIVSLSNKRDKAKYKEKEKNQESQPTEIKKEPIYCSFCGRPNTQVVKMVQGPGVNICSECTMIAVQYLILDDKMPSGEAQKILDIFWSKV